MNPPLYRHGDPYVFVDGELVEQHHQGSRPETQVWA